MGVMTSEHPKCMTEVYGTQTILGRQLDQLNEFGITDIVITTGSHDKVLRNYVTSLSIPLNVQYVLNNDYKTTNYIYSIYCAREFLDDDIVLMHGDLVFETPILDDMLRLGKSCMAVSSTCPLPEKDFKAVVSDNVIKGIGIDLFENSVAAQPLYVLKQSDWRVWLDRIIDFCEHDNRNCYAENAFNEVSDKCCIYTYDVRDALCNEIDTPEDLDVVSKRLEKVEKRTVYVSFSTDILHSGHIELIKKARRLGRLIIGVISDEVVSSYKRYPMLPFEERAALFENIRGVHKVVEQKTLSYKENIEKYKPEFVVHGDDWSEGFQKPIRDEVVELLSEYGGKLIEFPYAKDPKYRSIERNASIDRRMLYIENRYDIFDDWLVNSYIKSLLLVCGKNVMYHPLYKHICCLEETAGIKVTQFSEFEPNPKFESVVKGVKTFIENECDSILALGGGSTMDVAKCIKLFANMDHDRNYLEQRIEENNIPLMMIPTTAGTGSEATRYAVIYYNGVKQSITHEDCIPSMVFMDPSFLKTVDPYHRKSTMLDALCHSIESYWSVNSTDESKAYAREAITLILESKDSYLRNENVGNINMQRASQLAGRAINITQTTAGHAMCYMLTSIYGIAHGIAAALCVDRLWPYMIDHTEDCIDKRGEKYLVNTLRELATAFDCDTPKEASEVFSYMIKELKIESPKIKNTGELDQLVSGVASERLKNNPVALSKESIYKLYSLFVSEKLSFP